MAKQKNTSKENPLERNTAPMRAEGTTTLTVLGVLMTIASVLTLNPILIGASIVLLFLFSIAASSLQRSENMETYLRDIRDALNLQTVRLDSIYRQMAEVEGARRATEEIEEKVGELRDIAEEARDLLETMQPEDE